MKELKVNTRELMGNKIKNIFRRNCYTCKHLEYASGDTGDPEGYVCNKKDFQGREEDEMLQKMEDEKYLLRGKRCNELSEIYWRSCTGCHETIDGQETGNYPYSEEFRCYLGSGCAECGGLGATQEIY